MENFRRYKLVGYSSLIKITNSTVLNKLQSDSRISALGPQGHCRPRPTSRFKSVCVSCRPHVDHKGEGVWLMWTEEGVKNLIFVCTP